MELGLFLKWDEVMFAGIKKCRVRDSCVPQVRAVFLSICKLFRVAFGPKRCLFWFLEGKGVD